MPNLSDSAKTLVESLKRDPWQLENRPPFDFSIKWKDVAIFGMWGDSSRVYVRLTATENNVPFKDSDITEIVSEVKTVVRAALDRAIGEV